MRMRKKHPFRWFGWGTIIENKKVELARGQTGPFDFHFQGHLLQKLSTHSVMVDIEMIRKSGGVEFTR
jgi:hypothetical protein